MPLYEFHCPECNKEFEKIVGLGIKETKCPECESMSSKVMSASNFKIFGYSEANGYSKYQKRK